MHTIDADYTPKILPDPAAYAWMKGQPMLKTNGRLNLDHPWTVRPYGNTATTGFLTYASKVNRGHYFAPTGQPVSVEVARAAGFDVDADMIAKDRQERLAKVTAEINQEIQSAPQTVLEEKDGYALVDIGLGRANVTDPEGRSLNPRPMSVAEATKLFKAMTGGGNG